MKILVAYDGSECADAAIADLKNAGLGANTEALVVSLADVLLPKITAKKFTHILALSK